VKKKMTEKDELLLGHCPKCKSYEITATGESEYKCLNCGEHFKSQEVIWKNASEDGFKEAK
jgi:tRNA(Ile2) C34 agmatinyltransferase TiaS